MFAALGTASYGVREIARVRDDAAMRSRLFWEIELMTVMTSSVCIAVWFAFIAFTPQYKVIYLVLTMGKSYIWVLFMLSLSLLTGCAGDLSDGGMMFSVSADTTGLPAPDIELEGIKSILVQ